MKPSSLYRQSAKPQAVGQASMNAGRGFGYFSGAVQGGPCESSLRTTTYPRTAIIEGQAIPPDFQVISAVAKAFNSPIDMGGPKKGFQSLRDVVRMGRAKQVDFLRRRCDSFSFAEGLVVLCLFGFCPDMDFVWGAPGDG